MFDILMSYLRKISIKATIHEGIKLSTLIHNIDNIVQSLTTGPRLSDDCMTTEMMVKRVRWKLISLELRINLLWIF